MGQIYSAPEELKVPDIAEASKIGFDAYLTKCNKYVSDVKAWAKKHGNCPEAGKEVGFPVADGHARYVVVSLKPVKLIHLPVGDAWEFQYANRLTARDIRNEIDRRKSLNKLFGSTPFAKKMAGKVA